MGGLYVVGKRWYKDYKVESAYMEMHKHAFPNCNGKCPVNGSHSIKAQIEKLQETQHGRDLLEQYRNIGIHTTVTPVLSTTGIQTEETQLEKVPPISANNDNIFYDIKNPTKPPNNSNDNSNDTIFYDAAGSLPGGQSYKSRVLRRKHTKLRTAKPRTAKLRTAKLRTAKLRTAKLRTAKRHIKK